MKVENNLKESVLKAVNEIGGFENFVNKGETVLLKPNFNTADPAPASTDIGFLKAVVELIYECGAKIVMIGDSSTMSLNTSIQRFENSFWNKSQYLSLKNILTTPLIKNIITIAI